MTKFRFKHETEVSKRTDRSFGFKDTKGREFGAMVRAGTIEAEEVGEEARMWNSINRAGLFHFYRPHAMRGGQLYGALQSTQYFDTAEERDAAVDRYFREAEKRAAKNKARA